MVSGCSQFKCTNWCVWILWRSLIKIFAYFVLKEIKLKGKLKPLNYVKYGKETFMKIFIPHLIYRYWSKISASNYLIIISKFFCNEIGLPKMANWQQTVFNCVANFSQRRNIFKNWKNVESSNYKRSTFPRSFCRHRNARLHRRSIDALLHYRNTRKDAVRKRIYSKSRYSCCVVNHSITS